MCPHETVPADDFEFVVTGAFVINGRGVGVTGDFVHGTITCGSAYLHTGTKVVHIEKMSVEFLCHAGGSEELALLLYGLSLADVPIGSSVRSF